MASLGFTPHARSSSHGMSRPPRKESTLQLSDIPIQVRDDGGYVPRRSTSRTIIEPKSTAGSGMTKAYTHSSFKGNKLLSASVLPILFTLTACGHTALLVAILLSDSPIASPMSLTRIRLRPTASDALGCAFERNSTCTSDIQWSTTNASSCTPISTFPTWTDAHTITEVFGIDSSKYLFRVALIIIQAITLSSDAIKAYLFTYPTMVRASFQGRLPLQWVEYAITSSVMVAITAAVSHIREIGFLISLGFSHAGMLYIGWATELLLSRYMYDEALVMLMQPGVLITASVWVPIILSIGSSQHLFCDTSTSSTMPPFICDRTCYGQEYPVPLFAVANLLLFLLLPCILLYKIYVLSGTEKSWIAGSSERPRLLSVLLSVLGFLGYILFAPIKSVLVLIPNTTERALQTKETIHTQRDYVTTTGHVAYAITNLTARAFFCTFLLLRFGDVHTPW